MARADYLTCDDCDCKLHYDGHWDLRESMESRWNSVDALCPSCIERLRARVQKLEAALCDVAHKRPPRLTPDEWGEIIARQAEASP